MKNDQIHSNLIVFATLFFSVAIVTLFFIINWKDDNSLPYNIKFIINFWLTIASLVNIITLLNWKFVYYDIDHIYYRPMYSKKMVVVKKTDIITLTNLFTFNDYLNYRIQYKNISGEIQSIVFLSLKSKKEIRYIIDQIKYED
jgi:hypothetical protein